jgi:uncharacterized protein (UPF0335 family)
VTPRAIHLARLADERRKRRADEIAEEEAIMETYKAALGME